MKHESDGITYSTPNGGKYKCQRCEKRYNDKEEECNGR